MAIVATARATGGGNILLPERCDSVAEMPWDLARAIDHASMVLGWRENLLPEDSPPSWMLPFDDELTLWFDEVKARREAENAGDDVSDMESNDLAKGRR